MADYVCEAVALRHCSLPCKGVPDGFENGGAACEEAVEAEEAGAEPDEEGGE